MKCIGSQFNHVPRNSKDREREAETYEQIIFLRELPSVTKLSDYKKDDVASAS